MSAYPPPPVAAAPAGAGIRAELAHLLALRHALPSGAGRRRAAAGGHDPNPQAHYGRGLAVAGTRPWQRGDERRHIDWRRLARLRQPYSKEFHAEHDRQVLIAVDDSAPMHFGSRRAFKSVAARELAALIAWRALAGDERVGGGLWRGDGHRLLRPQPRLAGVLALLGLLAPHAAVPPDADGGLAVLLAALTGPLRRDDRVHLLSDFRALDRVTTTALRRLAQRCRLTLWLLADPLEHDPPTRGHLPLSDAAGDFAVDLGNATVRAALLAPYADRCAQLTRLAGESGGVLRTVSTRDSVATLAALAADASPRTP